MREISIPQNLNRKQTLGLVPHSGKMFLLSRIVSHDAKNRKIVSEFDVDEKCIFFEEELGGIPNWVSFEVMAQTLAALTGIVTKTLALKPRAGCILSVTDFESSMPVFKKGTVLQTSVREDFCEEEAGVYKYFCETRDAADGKILACAGVTALQADDLKKLTEGLK